MQKLTPVCAGWPRLWLHISAGFQPRPVWPWQSLDGRGSESDARRCLHAAYMMSKSTTNIATPSNSICSKVVSSWASRCLDMGIEHDDILRYQERSSRSLFLLDCVERSRLVCVQTCGAVFQTFQKRYKIKMYIFGPHIFITVDSTDKTGLVRLMNTVVTVYDRQNRIDSTESICGYKVSSLSPSQRTVGGLHSARSTLLVHSCQERQEESSRTIRQVLCFQSAS